MPFTQASDAAEPPENCGRSDHAQPFVPLPLRHIEIRTPQHYFVVRTRHCCERHSEWKQSRESSKAFGSHQQQEHTEGKCKCRHQRMDKSGENQKETRLNELPIQRFHDGKDCREGTKIT